MLLINMRMLQYFIALLICTRYSSLLFKYMATTEIYTYLHTLPLHDALPILKTKHSVAYYCSYFIPDLCPPSNYLYDSMLMWYSRFSELPKTLDFVSSI